MAEILIVDDERTLREGLESELQGEGYAVRTAHDGAEALAMIAERRPDLVLLDVMMPNLNGFRCCEEIRKTDALLPVVFLTAKDGEADQIRAIGLGGDDFISKTASDALLFACIRRALDRAAKTDERLSLCEDHQVCVGGVVVDLDFLVVREDGREIARLTKTEADVLRCLDAHRGEMVTYDELVSDLRGCGFACEDAMLYTHVCRLRAKLGKAGSKIATVRRVGYSLFK